MSDSQITDGEVKQMFNKMLERNPDECPICSGSISTTTHELYERGCTQCGTKFMMSEADEDADTDKLYVPAIVIETTPVKRMKKLIWEKVHKRAALESFRDDE
jgi:predicted  nucleic acid-binding Zn-ribbon protein